MGKEFSIAGHRYAILGGKNVPLGYGHVPVEKEHTRRGRTLPARVVSSDRDRQLRHVLDAWDTAQSSIQRAEDAVTSARFAESRATADDYLTVARLALRTAKFAGTTLLKYGSVAHISSDERRKIRQRISKVSRMISEEQGYVANRANPTRRRRKAKRRASQRGRRSSVSWKR